MTPELGKILKGFEVKDATHIAIQPVIVMEDLTPGQHVGLDKTYTGEGYAVTSLIYHKIGIVDPFITTPIKKGDCVYLWLYPNTVEDMTHNWYHSSFTKEEKIDPKSKAYLKLQKILDDCGCCISPSSLLEQFKDNEDSIYVGDDDAQVNMYDRKFEIFDLLNILADTYRETDDIYFRCAC